MYKITTDKALDYSKRKVCSRSVYLVSSRLAASLRSCSTVSSSSEEAVLSPLSSSHWKGLLTLTLSPPSIPLMVEVTVLWRLSWSLQ